MAQELPFLFLSSGTFYEAVVIREEVPGNQEEVFLDCFSTTLKNHSWSQGTSLIITASWNIPDCCTSEEKRMACILIER